MKFKYLLVSTCLVFLTFSSTIFPSDIGIKAGISLANFQTSEPLTMDIGTNVEYPVDLNNFTSWQAGLFIGFELFSGFSLQPEIHYVTRGMKVDETILGVSIKTNVELKYVEVPLLFKYNLSLGSSLKPILYAGPYFAMNLRAEQVIEAVGQKWEEDIKDDIKDFDFGLIFGGGIEDEIGSIKVIFDVRLSFGLIDINETPGSHIKVKNKSIVFLAGIGF